MRNLAVFTIAIAVLAGGATSAHATEFTINGSLEDPSSAFVNTVGNYMSLLAGSTAIAGWTVSSTTTNEIVWAKSPTSDSHNAAAGTFFVDLTGFGGDSPNGAIEQMLTGLVVGQSYSYSMDVEVVGSLPLVTVGGTGVTLSPGPPFSVGIDRWTPETGTFTATSPNELLQISNALAGQQIDFIDNISVTGPSAAPTVPEPATLTLMALGLAGVVRRYRGRHSTR
jgi:hypothetical protein